MTWRSDRVQIGEGPQLRAACPWLMASLRATGRLLKNVQTKLGENLAEDLKSPSEVAELDVKVNSI